jgi:hypothetical protein
MYFLQFWRLESPRLKSLYLLRELTAVLSHGEIRKEGQERKRERKRESKRGTEGEGGRERETDRFILLSRAYPHTNGINPSRDHHLNVLPFNTVIFVSNIWILRTQTIVTGYTK